jgi:hypothetical protein
VTGLEIGRIWFVNDTAGASCTWLDIYADTNRIFVGGGYVQYGTGAVVVQNTAETTNGTHADRPQNITFRDTYFYGQSGVGVYLQGGSGLTFENCVVDGAGTQGWRTGVYLDGNVRLENCVAKNCGNDGFYFAHLYTDNVILLAPHAADNSQTTSGVNNGITINAGVSVKIMGGNAGIGEGWTGANAVYTWTTQPNANDTFTVGSQTYTFVTSGATGNQINIGASLAATITAAAAVIAASTDSVVSCLQAVTTGTTLTLNYGIGPLAGAQGNTIAAGINSTTTPAGTVQGAALISGSGSTTFANGVGTARQNYGIKISGPSNPNTFVDRVTVYGNVTSGIYTGNTSAFAAITNCLGYNTAPFFPGAPGNNVFPFINGSGALTYGSYIQSGTFTPTISAATPGDLAITYSTQVGQYTKIGNIVFFSINLACSAFTYTTASGNLLISGLPFTANALIYPGAVTVNYISAATWSTAYNTIAGSVLNSTSSIVLQVASSTHTTVILAITTFASGTPPTLRLTGWYMTPS